MSTPEPMSMDQAIEAMIQPEEQPTEEVVEETESLSDAEATDELEEEQPVADSDDDGEEVDDADDEPESDDADDEGDEDYEDDVDDAEDEDPAQELYTVKVDGEETQVTLEDLKQGYSGQKYVQQGMQKVAEAKKEAEQVYVALMQERQNLAELVNQVQQGSLTPPKEPSRELFDSDPLGYMEAKMDYDQKITEYNEKVGQVQQQLQQQSVAEQNARARYVEGEVAKLVEVMPELADPKKAEAWQARVNKAGEKFGFSKEELAAVDNHRVMLVLDAASKYLELQSGKETVRQKSKKARKPIKAGAKKTNRKADAARAQRDKLRQSGSIQDAMALILDPNLK